MTRRRLYGVAYHGGMRRWVKVTLGGFALVAVAVMVLAATGAYFVFRHMETRAAAEADAIQAIDAVKARFGARPPLVEVVDPRRADIRINRAIEPSSTAVDTIHVMNWKSETGELVSTEVPLWLMRFSTLNIASQLGIAPAKFQLTVSDIQRYGPGIVVDYGIQKELRLLIWVE
jgi:hypothetical protein